MNVNRPQLVQTAAQSVLCVVTLVFALVVTRHLRGLPPLLQSSVHVPVQSCDVGVFISKSPVSRAFGDVCTSTTPLFF